MIRMFVFSFVVTLTAAPTGFAADPTYGKDVQPFLKKYCVECHTGAKAKAGVTLDSFESLMKPGRKGRKNVVPGDPEKSSVVTSTEGKAGHKMPPRKYASQPTAKEIEVLRDWVKAGAKNEPEAKTSSVERRIELRPAKEQLTKQLRFQDAASR